MKSTIIKSIFLLATGLFFCFSAYSQDKIDVKGEKVTNTRGANAYVIPTADEPAPKPAASRGMCCLNFDNWTGYTIHVWVDNTYRGTVSSWSEGNVCVGNGFTTWYAQTTGGTYSWSNSGNCQDYYNLILD